MRGFLKAVGFSILTALFLYGFIKTEQNQIRSSHNQDRLDRMIFAQGFASGVSACKRYREDQTELPDDIDDQL